MSTPSFDLILLWSLESGPDSEHSALETLLTTDFPNQFNVYPYQTTEQAIEHFQSRTKSSRPLMVITKLGTNPQSSGKTLIETIRARDKSTFIILHSHTACADTNLRWYFSKMGANMITDSIPQIRQILPRLLRLIQADSDNKYACPHCHWPSLSFEQLYDHVPLFHTNEPEFATKCDVCRKSTRNYAVHIHEEHDDAHQHKPAATPLYAFALVVCHRKRDNRFLLVQEAGSMGFWLPGGRVEVGERLDRAAERETLEEAGVKVRLTGVLKMEFTPKASMNRLRVIYYAEPLDENDCEPKTIPDYESYGAIWATYEQVVQAGEQNQLRGNEPLSWFKYVVQNGTIHPLSILS